MRNTTLGRGFTRLSESEAAEDGGIPLDELGEHMYVSCFWCLSG
jgi:hypothetical protein